MKKIFDSVTEMVGATPMLRMHRLAAAHDVKAVILAKCEMYNPLFSVKDRVALRMIEAAEKQGLIDDETILMEATSGNTGIGLAAISAAKGYKLVICMPENMSKERIALMRHLGAEVILTPKEDGMKGALAKADMLAEKNPHVLILSQFSNQANPDAHRFGTSMEIMEQTGGEVDVLVSAVGTSGTLTGTASTLRTSNPDLYVVAVEPKSSAVLSGGKAGPMKFWRFPIKMPLTRPKKRLVWKGFRSEFPAAPRWPPQLRSGNALILRENRLSLFCRMPQNGICLWDFLIRADNVF